MKDRDKFGIAFEWLELRDAQLPSPALDAEANAKAMKTGWFKAGFAGWIGGGAICLLLLVWVGSVWLERAGKAGLELLETELALAAEAEFWHSAGLREDSVARLHRIEQQIEHHGEIHSSRIEALEADMAAVTVITRVENEDDSSTLYRQLRFFGRTEGGWHAIAPKPRLWGEPEELVTQHFHFSYGKLDADAVLEAAGELDDLYVRMRRSLALAPALSNRRLIHVLVEPVGDQFMASQSDTALGAVHNRIVVGSPALEIVPESVPGAAVLLRMIFPSLLDLVIEEAILTHAIPMHWLPLLNAWRLQQDDKLIVPPMLCSECSWIDLYRSRGVPIPEYMHMFFSHFPYVESSAFPGHQSDLNNDNERRRELIVGLSILDYVNAVYGQEIASSLWPVLREYRNWEGLIEPVFRRSPAQFATEFTTWIEQQLRL